MPNLLKLRPKLTHDQRAMLWYMFDYDGYMTAGMDINALNCPDNVLPNHLWLLSIDKIIENIGDPGDWHYKETAKQLLELCRIYGESSR